MKKIINWFLKFFKWLFSHLKDKVTIIVFVVITSIAVSPIVLGYTLGFVLNNNYLIGIATGWILFWLAPATPVWTVIIALSLAISKTIKFVIRKRGGK